MNYEAARFKLRPVVWTDVVIIHIEKKKTLYVETVGLSCFWAEISMERKVTTITYSS